MASEDLLGVAQAPQLLHGPVGVLLGVLLVVHVVEDAGDGPKLLVLPIAAGVGPHGHLHRPHVPPQGGAFRPGLHEGEGLLKARHALKYTHAHRLRRGQPPPGGGEAALPLRPPHSKPRGGPGPLRWGRRPPRPHRRPPFRLRPWGHRPPLPRHRSPLAGRAERGVSPGGPPPRGSAGAKLLQASLVLTLDRPKLGPHRKALVDSLSRLLRLPQDRIGLTFKTSEGLAPSHVQARAVVLLDG